MDCYLFGNHRDDDGWNPMEMMNWDPLQCDVDALW